MPAINKTTVLSKAQAKAFLKKNQDKYAIYQTLHRQGLIIMIEKIIYHGSEVTHETPMFFFVNNVEKKINF